MKTWLKRYSGCLLAGIAMVLMFILGWYARQYITDRQAYAALWEAIVTLPDPAQCALCGAATRHHALCLIDLSTGQMDELTVYETDPVCPWELLPMAEQRTVTFSFHDCAGLVGIRDTGSHTCTVTLPAERKLMNPALFCHDCRALLAAAGLEGYAVADLYDLNDVQTYPVRKDSSEVIRDYRVSVSEKKDGAWKLCVTGLR